MIINVPFKRQTGLFGLGADLKQDRQSGGLQITGSSAKRRTSTSSGASGVGRASSTHRSSGGAPPPAPSPEVVDAVNNLPPNVTDSQPFRKGPALQPDTIRVDAGSGEPAYNPSNPIDRLHFQVLQAGDLMRRRAAGIPTPAPVPVEPIVAPQTYSGGGGGGGGGDSSSAPTTDPAAPGFWASASTTTKVALVGGGLLVVGLGIYFMTRKGRGGGGAGPRHKS